MYRIRCMEHDSEIERLLDSTLLFMIDVTLQINEQAAREMNYEFAILFIYHSTSQKATKLLSSFDSKLWCSSFDSSILLQHVCI